MMRRINKWSMLAAFVAGAISHGLSALSGWYFVGFIEAGRRVFDAL